MVKIQLPAIYCPDCTSQLGFSGVYLVPDAPESKNLVCMFCARDRFKAGATGLRCVASPGPTVPDGRHYGWDGEGDPLDQREACALWMGKGATIHGRYEDPSGDLADPDDVRRALLAELAGEG